MTAIGTLGPGNSGVPALPEVASNDVANERDADALNSTTPTLVEGVKVSLSGASIARDRHCRR
ncbi:hypothetical protein [Pseudomonas sp. S11A4]|uniref:hypothetical protein n=1 Tax=Pseudomonas sp. S11A4 TaxID=1476791 RepID=UPI003158E435